MGRRTEGDPSIWAKGRLAFFRFCGPASAEAALNSAGCARERKSDQALNCGVVIRQVIRLPQFQD